MEAHETSRFLSTENQQREKNGTCVFMCVSSFQRMTTLCLQTFLFGFKGIHVTLEELKQSIWRYKCLCTHCTSGSVCLFGLVGRVSRVNKYCMNCRCSCKSSQTWNLSACKLQNSVLSFPSPLHRALLSVQNISCQQTSSAWEHSVLPRHSFHQVRTRGGLKRRKEEEWGYMWVKLAHEKGTRRQITIPPLSAVKSQSCLLCNRPNPHTHKQRNSFSSCFSAHTPFNCAALI